MSDPTNITSEGASKKLVPELRFPEFQNKCEWSEYVFGELFIYLPNNTLSRAELTEKRKDVQNIHYGDILIKFPNVLDVQNELLPSISDTEKIRNIETSRLRDGDVVIADTAEDETVGKCTELVNVGDSLIVSGLHTIPCRPNITFTKGYLGHYMNSNAFHHRLRPLMQGAKVTSISKTGLKNVTLTFPHSIAEQQKIAQCLSSLDELIAATKEKVELLKEHKRGLMQKLFPAKGKTLPELRFPEFNDDGEWKYVPMCRISRKITDKYKSDKTLPVLTNSASSGVVKQQDYFDREIVTKSNLDNYQILDVDDFVYNPRISSIAPVGPISRNNLTKGIMSPLYTVFRFHDGDKEFLEHFFNSNSWHDYIKKKANFGARYDRINISTDEFFGLPIPLPSIAEQKKIASVLSFLDDMIEQYIEKVNVLELHKKGLMQKLFPQK